MKLGKFVVVIQGFFQSWSPIFLVLNEINMILNTNDREVKENIHELALSSISFVSAYPSHYKFFNYSSVTKIQLYVSLLYEHWFTTKVASAPGQNTVLSIVNDSKDFLLEGNGFRSRSGHQGSHKHEWEQDLVNTKC